MQNVQIQQGSNLNIVITYFDLEDKNTKNLKIIRSLYACAATNTTAEITPAEKLMANVLFIRRRY